MEPYETTLERDLRYTRERALEFAQKLLTVNGLYLVSEDAILAVAKKYADFIINVNNSTERQS